MLTIKSLISLQKNRFKDPLIKQIFQECESRILAMARMHEMISESKNLGELDCKTYITNLTKELTTNLAVNVEIDLEINVEEVNLENSTIITIGIIIAEIFTNIFKHAYNNKTKGTICLNLRHKKGNRYTLFVSDDGVGFNTNDEDSKSLGTMIISAYTEQLNGTIKVTNIKGTEVNIEFENEIE